MEYLYKMKSSVRVKKEEVNKQHIILNTYETIRRSSSAQFQAYFLSQLSYGTLVMWCFTVEWSGNSWQSSHYQEIIDLIWELSIPRQSWVYLILAG